MEMDNSALQGAKEEIIVCANDRAIRGFHQRCLVGAGHRVTVCETFPALEEALAKSIPDLIILDYAFGGFPGLGAAAEIYAHPAYSTIPLILLIFRSQQADLVIPEVLFQGYVRIQCKNYKCDHFRTYVDDFIAQKQDGERLKERAIDLMNRSPGSVEGYLLLGRALEMLQKRTDAIAAYNMAVEIDPDCIEAYSSLGSIYWGIGNKEAAIQNYSQLARLQPTNVANLRVLGFALYGVGQREKAREVWTQGLEYADPSTKEDLLTLLRNSRVAKP